MLIECPYCRSRVDAKVHGSRRYVDTVEHSDPEVVSVGECPSCSTTLVGRQQEVEHPDYGPVLTDSERLWPRPKRPIAWSVPDIVKVSLEEAHTHTCET